MIRIRNPALVHTGTVPYRTVPYQRKIFLNVPVPGTGTPTVRYISHRQNKKNLFHLEEAILFELDNFLFRFFCHFKINYTIAALKNVQLKCRYPVLQIVDIGGPTQYRHGTGYRYLSVFRICYILVRIRSADPYL